MNKKIIDKSVDKFVFITEKIRWALTAKSKDQTGIEATVVILDCISTISTDLSAKANKEPFNLYKKTCCSHFETKFLELQYLYHETVVQTNRIKFEFGTKILESQYLFDEAVVQTNNLNSTGLVRAKDIIKHNTKGSTNTLILISVKTDRIHIIISTMINSGDVVILMNHRRLTLAIFDSSIAALIVGDVVKTTNHKSFQIFTRITLIAQETNKAVSTSEIVVVGTDQAKSTTNDPASHALASHALATQALASHALASHALASHAPAPHVPTSYAPAEKVCQLKGPSSINIISISIIADTIMSRDADNSSLISVNSDRIHKRLAQKASNIELQFVDRTDNCPDHLLSSSRNSNEVNYAVQHSRDDKSRVLFDKPIMWPVIQLVPTMDQMLAGPGTK